LDQSEQNTIEYQIEQWYNTIKSKPGFTDADAEELKTHLLDMKDELQDAGLDEEETFIIATRRLGNVVDIQAEYRQENQDVIQTRRSAIILSGVLIYFFSFHFVGSLAKLIFMGLLEIDVPGPRFIFWMNRFFITAHFLLIILFTSILLSEKKVIIFIENLKIRPRNTIVFLIITFILGATNVSLMALAKNMAREDYSLRGQLIHSHIYFEYTFPLLFCIGFILIYFKYYRKAKIYPPSLIYICIYFIFNTYI